MRTIIEDPNTPGTINVSDGPSPDEALKALDAAMADASAGTPGMWCFVPIVVGAGEAPCGRPRANAKDLCCADHWKLLPRKLRVALIEANKLRSEKQRERATVLAADKAVEYLTSLKIQLPPVRGLAREETKIIRPDGIARPGAMVSGESKLIIPR